MVEIASSQVGGLELGCYFSIYIGHMFIPTDETHHFSEGWLDHQPVVYIYIYSYCICIYIYSYSMVEGEYSEGSSQNFRHRWNLIEVCN